MVEITITNVSKTCQNCSKVEYLSVPAATLVSSEWLFSDAGNLINTKRTNFDTNLAAIMLFLKRNQNTMHILHQNGTMKQVILRYIRLSQ